MEPYKYKVGSPKRGNAWTQIADILNSISEPKFRVNQRAVRDRFNLLEKTFKKKMADEEKASGINPQELSNNELAIQEIIEKSAEVSIESNDNAQANAERQKAEEMRNKSLETYTETRARIEDESPKSKGSRASGSETVSVFNEKIGNRCCL